MTEFLAREPLMAKVAAGFVLYVLFVLFICWLGVKTSSSDHQEPL